MSFARDKRLLLGWMALVAPVPLPLNDVVSWPTLVLFELAAALFLVRAWRGAEEWLPGWAMNLLALVYLPVLIADVSQFRRGSLLEPLVRLALFAVAVKLFGLRREGDKWQALIAIFFVFLAAAGTSVHPSIVLYLVLFLTLAVLTLARFASFHVVGSLRAGRASVPLRGFVTFAVLAVVVGAVPLFALLPRLRQPYLFGPGSPGGGDMPFFDRLTLDTIGDVRNSRSVVLRYAFDGSEPAAFEERFKAATFDRFSGGSWHRGPRAAAHLQRAADGFFRLGGERARSWMTIWLKRLESGRLVLPVAARALDLPVARLGLEETGVVRVPGSPPPAVSYRVGLSGASTVAAAPPGDEATPDLDRSGVTPRIATLAREVMGDDAAGRRAARLESYLSSRHAYSLDPPPAAGADPVEAFLFETRAGHCELFATAMVLMLRAEGIPARLVTGYLGAEFNPLERYYIVRQSAAHAWVEVYLPEAGWTVFDPTPPAGRPQGAQPGLALLVIQAYDYLLFRWDRYVLSYGFFDQVGFFVRVRDLWRSFWRRLTGGGEADTAAPVEPAPSGFRPEPAVAGGAARVAGWTWLPLLVLLLTAAGYAWHHRAGWSATRAYRQLRGRLPDDSPPARDCLPPGAVESHLLGRFPHARAEIRRVVELYLEESFADRRLSAKELAEVREAVRRVRRSGQRQSPLRKAS